MPVTRSAKKKLRQDKRRKRENLLVKKAVRNVIKTFRRAPSSTLLSKVFSLLDTSAKKKILHTNKVARLKSRLTKLLSKKAQVAAVTTSTHLKKKTSRKKKSVV